MLHRIFPSEVKKPKNVLDTLWSAYWSAKEQVKALQAELSELEEKILAETAKQGLWKEGKQTATYGTNKISYTFRHNLVVPKNFDFSVFLDKFPNLCKTSIDSVKVARLLTNADERTELHDFGLDAEVTQVFTFKKA
ncbi:MAG: hypothetical protein Fur0027_14370 [Raineya sp.]